jgi:hypothetical protein
MFEGKSEWLFILKERIGDSSLREMKAANGDSLDEKFGCEQQRAEDQKSVL